MKALTPEELLEAVTARAAELAALPTEQKIKALVTAIEQGLIFDGRSPSVYGRANIDGALPHAGELAAALIAAGGRPSVWSPDRWPLVVWVPPAEQVLL